MSTANDNRYDVSCDPNTNTCTTPDGEKFTYDPENRVVVTDQGSIPVADSKDGMSNPINIGDYLEGAHGWIDLKVED